MIIPVYYIAGFPVSDELYHHGIKGLRWGVRRYQNEDGSVTAAGAKRYYEDPSNARQRFDFSKSTKKENRKEKKEEKSLLQHHESGYKHSSNILRTAGKVAVKTLGYSIATQAAMAVGGKKVAAIVGAAGAVSIASTIRDSYTNARDYERYRKIRTTL